MKRISSTTLLTIFIVNLTAILSCTEQSEDPKPDRNLFNVAEGWAYGAATRVKVFSFEELATGYNPIFISLLDSITGAPITDSQIRLNPQMQMPAMRHSCPTEHPDSKGEDGMFPGAVIFTMPSGEDATWTLDVTVKDPKTGASGTAPLNITVRQSEPSRMQSFIAENGRRYYLSIFFPEKVRTGVNDLDITAFTFETGQYLPIETLSILLTAEMPSMNHGAPDNKAPENSLRGHYYGEVNFTMSGEWRLNLQIKDGSYPLGTRSFDVIVE